MSNKTVAEAFDTAIAAEKALENLFHRLETKFSHSDEVCQLWKNFAQDETWHIKWLENLKAKLERDELEKVVDEPTIVLMDAVSKLSVEKALKGIHDFEDAYELATEIENGEINAIFRFLVDHFEADEKMRDFLREQLNSHVGRLATDLPSQYKGITARRKIKVSE